jgi:hypothetical protein
VRAMRAHYASRLRLRLDVVVAIAVALVGAYLGCSPDSHWLGVTAVSVSAAFALTLVAAFTLIPPLAFRRKPKFRDEYSLTFRTAGIHFRTEHIDSGLQWSLYTRALVDANSYVLYYGSRSFTVIPKRIFQSVEQQGAFDTLLTENVAQVVRTDG